MIPRCFWGVACIILLLLNTSGGCDIALAFQQKMASCACVFVFFWIWVKTHSPLKGPTIYLCQFAIQLKSRGIAAMDHRKQGLVISK